MKHILGFAFTFTVKRHMRMKKTVEHHNKMKLSFMTEAFGKSVRQHLHINLMKTCRKNLDFKVSIYRLAHSDAWDVYDAMVQNTTVLEEMSLFLSRSTLSGAIQLLVTTSFECSNGILCCFFCCLVLSALVVPCRTHSSHSLGQQGFSAARGSVQQ